MPAEKYHKAYLEEQFPVALQEHLRADGLDPTHLPTYDYLNAKGFETRGLSQAIQRHFGAEMTLHQFLRQHGFGHQVEGKWPTTHEETINHLNGYRASRRERNDDAADTISTMESGMRAALRAMQELHDVDNLLLFARYETEVERQARNKKIEAVLDKFKADLSDGAFENYTRYLKDFYEYAKPRTRIDHNPVTEVEGQYNSDATPESDPDPPTDDQIRTLWETLKQLPDRRDLTEDVENLATRHGLREWQVFMMALLTLGVGVGPRSREYIRDDCREHWILDDDPYIEFPVRKNLPGEVPVLARPEFLAAFRDYMEETRDDWNGKPFPNPNTESGSRSANTLNNWLDSLCVEAGVRCEDGSTLTMQNLRQCWHTQYHKVLRKNKVQLKLVADEAGTQNEKHVEVSYRSDKEEREMIRALATRDFDDLLPLDELPDVMSTVLNQAQYMDTQTELDEF
jgi:hypothetical protein